MERRPRKQSRFDPQSLRDERASRNHSESERFTQEEMAEHIGIGLSTYQKAEAGECVDDRVADQIVTKLDADPTALGRRACAAAAPTDTEAYRKWVHEEYGSIDVRGLIIGSGRAPRLPIDKIYIPLHAAGGARDQEDRKHDMGPQAPVALELMVKQHRRLVIVGDPGGGKTTFLKRRAWEQSGQNSTSFPVLIRIFALEDFIHRGIHGHSHDAPSADSADWIPRYLESLSHENRWGLDAEFFRAKLRERSTLIMLDGLDEVPSAARREAIARLFERAVKAFREASFIVTTRPAAYHGKATLDADQFETVSIGDLDTPAVEGFLEEWSGLLHQGNRAAARRNTEDLLAARRARVEIRRMTSNPLMLTALAVIQWNERRLPEQRADLYASILKWLSEAQEQYKDRPKGHECLSIFATLALGMQRAKGGRVKQSEKARAAEIIAPAPQFRRAAEGRREAAALEFLENELIDSGIIVGRGASIEFWHLTFQEFLAARAIASMDRPADELFDAGQTWRKPEWREVMLLAPGILIHTGATKVDAIFTALLDRADGASGKGALAVKARAAGLLAAALHDVQVYSPSYLLPDQGRYQALLREILGIFEAARAVAIDLDVRVEAAEALGQAGDPRLLENPEANWIALPGGKFLMGAQKTRKQSPGYDPEADAAEGPPRETNVQPFQIGKYPVTVEEFRRFVEDEEEGYTNEICWHEGGYDGREAPYGWDEQVLHPNRPVTSVNWFEASAYCVWAGKQSGFRIRLPKEEEWEYAARGREGRRYPWGSQPPDKNRANYDVNKMKEAAPVGLFPAGNTPEGVADLAGNVWEWTASRWDEELKVVRGASFDDDARALRGAYRDGNHSGYWNDGIGFRCVRE